MIVKNEEDVLGKCLSSVKDIVDEIIIVDTGSIDRTKEIASLYTEKIFDFKWINDFSAARNYSFSKAAMDYILWLDADDIIPLENKREFLTLKETLSPDVDSVMMQYHLVFDANGKPTYSTMRNRLVKRERGFKWIGFVHEYLEVSGSIEISPLAIHHNKIKAHSDRNLMIYEERFKNGEDFSPRDLYYYGNELSDHSLYEKAIHIYEEFLKTKQGWLEDQIAACIKMAHCYSCLNQKEEQIKSLLRTLIYDTPRAEMCCRMGEIFFEINDLDKAIYWYETACSLGSPPAVKGLLHEPSAWTWLPHLQLCVCYDRKGLIEKAIYHNLEAFKFNPEHPAVKHNLDYFEGLKAKESHGKET
jgi:glycosyltransferase involved in cell wall biosynthesis